MYFKIIHKLRKQKKLFTIKLSGFTLIELSIAMIIVGIVMAAAFKGADLLESARLQSCISDLNRYRLNIINYHSQYQQWPGNDANATSRFSDAGSNGDGRGLVQPNEHPFVWKHLFAAGILDSPDIPSSRIGGFISVKSDLSSQHKGNYLILSNEAGALTPLLTPKQAMSLKAKAGETKPENGNFIVLSGQGVEADSCIKNGEYNLDFKNPSCIVAVRF